MTVINAIFPVFAIIASGVGLSRFGFLSETQFSGLSRLTYWVGLPCFLFYKIATASYHDSVASKVFFIVALSMAFGIVLSYVFVLLLGLPTKSAGAFVQASFRGNLAFIGLPVIVYTSANWLNAGNGEIETLAILVMAPTIPIYNLLSVLVLLVGRRRLDLQETRQLLVQIITNPLLIASAAGFVFAITSVKLPLAVTRTLSAIGQMSLPLALLSIGGTLATVELRGSLWHSSIAALIKVAATPLFGAWLITIFPLGSHESKLALILLACPTAATSYVMAEQLNADKAIAAGTVVISTILAMISLSLAILWG